MHSMLSGILPDNYPAGMLGDGCSWCYLPPARHRRRGLEMEPPYLHSFSWCFNSMSYNMAYTMTYSILRGISISHLSVLYSRGVRSHMCYIAGLPYHTFSCNIPHENDIKHLLDSTYPFRYSMLYSTAIEHCEGGRVLYFKGVMWQIWVLYSSDPRFQMMVLNTTQYASDIAS